MPLTLEFEKAGKVSLSLEVQGVGAQGPAGPNGAMGPPGRGFHTGGSCPMRLAPHEFESDVLGRPYGCERVHIVDASVFPSITASTITLTAMANAHRIAAEDGRATDDIDGKQEQAQRMHGVAGYTMHTAALWR